MKQSPGSHRNAFAKVALTGHRVLQDKEHVTGELTRLAQKLRDEHSTTVAISGMALGADTLWAQAALSARLELHAYIPFEEQSCLWSQHQQQTWRRLREAAAREVLIGELDARLAPARLLHARNDAMIRDAALIIAVLDLSASTPRGGSWATAGKEQRWNGGRRPLLVVDASGEHATRLLAPGYDLPR